MEITGKISSKQIIHIYIYIFNNLFHNTNNINSNK